MFCNGNILVTYNHPPASHHFNEKGGRSIFCEAKHTLTPFFQQRVNVDFPLWMLEALDAEAGRLGVTRQSIIKVWLAERLQGLPAHS